MTKDQIYVPHLEGRKERIDCFIGVSDVAAAKTCPETAQICTMIFAYDVV